MTVFMKKEITKKDLRQFGVVFAVILTLIGFLQMGKGYDVVASFFWISAIHMVAFGLIAPVLLKPIFHIFTKVAHAMGWVNTRVVLVLVYYLILTPIGLIMRLFRKDLLGSHIDRSKETYWIKRKVGAVSKESLEKQF